MLIVLIATRWGAAEGGINAFNWAFAKGLAAVGGDEIEVVCAVEEVTDRELAAAEADDVQLIAVGAAATARSEICGQRVLAALSDAGARAQVDLWVGHDVKTGFAAVAAADALGGRAALIHHMAYESYRNLFGGRGEDTAARHSDQIDLFSSSGAILFGVGDDLRASAERLGAKPAHRIIPGFPADFEQNSAGTDDLRVVVAGRFDSGSEPLKQSRLTAAALGRAVRLAPDVASLGRPTLSIFGASAETLHGAELETLASTEAQKAVNVVPAPFDSTRGISRHLARANLLIMPSVREGFGLIGWEAIGCKVPLILGDQTGLHSLLQRTLDNHSDRWVETLTLTGQNLDERDISATANAIIKVARDLDYARQKATDLRDRLKDLLGGCTWPSAAQDFLQACTDADSSDRNVQLARHQPIGSTPSPDRLPLRATAVNYRDLCAELELHDSTGQGSTDRRIDVLATLRFGETELEVDGMEVSVGIQRALVRVTSEHGRLTGERLGEGTHAPLGIVANAGGSWELTPTEGRILKHKVLGDEVLCRVETPPNLPVHAKVKVTAARRDIACNFRSATPISRATEAVMKIFLENAVFEKASGYMVLSSAELREEQ